MGVGMGAPGLGAIPSEPLSKPSVHTKNPKHSVRIMGTETSNLHI
jgi:hypothetical protein